MKIEYNDGPQSPCTFQARQSGKVDKATGLVSKVAILIYPEDGSRLVVYIDRLDLQEILQSFECPERKGPKIEKPKPPMTLAAFRATRTWQDDLHAITGNHVPGFTYDGGLYLIAEGGGLGYTLEWMGDMYDYTDLDLAEAKLYELANAEGYLGDDSPKASD